MRSRFLRTIVVSCRFYITIVALAFFSTTVVADDQVHFDPDTEPSRINWSKLTTELGPVPNSVGKRFGVVLKTQTNEYWRLISAGYRKRAAADRVKLDIQAAQSESDPIQQLSIMETMIGGLYSGLLVSPMSSSNLNSAIEDAYASKIDVVDVDGAVVDNVGHFVGAVNRQMGMLVANWFVENYPKGGKLAVITGQAGVYSTIKRTAGFVETVQFNHKFQVVSILAGNWDRHKSYDAALDLIAKSPDLIGIYCNNDVMALGVVEAVEKMHRLDTIKVFGTDGTRDAYDSIKSNNLTGTVDIFPMLTADIGLEVAERLAGGQKVPRVVETPQALITREHMLSDPSTSLRLTP